MKNILILLLSVSTVACIKNSEESDIKESKTIDLPRVYEGCRNYKLSGEDVSQLETLSFLSETKMTWRSTFHQGADCQSSDMVYTDIFDITYSFDSDLEVFYEKSDKLRHAIHSQDKLDEANTAPGHCEIMGWAKDEFIDLTGIESDYCIGGFFMPSTEFTQEKTRSLGLNMWSLRDLFLNESVKTCQLLYFNGVEAVEVAADYKYINTSK